MGLFLLVYGICGGILAADYAADRRKQSFFLSVALASIWPLLFLIEFGRELRKALDEPLTSLRPGVRPIFRFLQKIFR